MHHAVRHARQEPLLALSRDVERINGYLNHPDIRPLVGHVELGEIDLTPFIEVDQHWFLVGEHGGFGALWRAPDVYEIHTFILPAGRGVWALRAAREAIAFAKDHGARMLWTMVPVDRPEVEFFSRAMGFHPTGQIVPVLGEPQRIFKFGEV